MIVACWITVFNAYSLSNLDVELKDHPDAQ